MIISESKAGPTPLERLYAIALDAGIDVSDLPADTCGDSFAGYVGVGIDNDDVMHGMIGLAEDLDEDLRVEVLAFAIAVLVGEIESICSTVAGGLGIGRRLPPARKGAGYLAWHMLNSCGHHTTSATFDLVTLD